MSSAPIRRSHLVAPFGTGALMVGPDGTSMLAAGLDHWYTRDGEGRDSSDIDPDEFRLEEWRLERRLGVSHFRLPPEHRRRQRGRQIPNAGLTIPFLRFPQWHFCWRCKRLRKLTLTALGRQKCQACQAEGKTSILAQVPFAAMCDVGHLQDFPWNEWVHKSAAPPAHDDRLSLIATGGATLANQLVKCVCGARRSLSQIVEASPDGDKTFLSTNLESGTEYLCRGVTPQHGSEHHHGCSRPLRGTLRSASNLYFGVIRSAIYLPRGSSQVPVELLNILQDDPDIADSIVALHDAGRAIDPARIRRFNRRALQTYSDAEIEQAAEAVIAAADQDDQIPEDHGEDEQTEEQFRRDEAAVLREAMEAPELTVRKTDPSAYGPVASSAFTRIQLVERLRETRVLAGFNRVFPDRPADPASRAAQLWAARPRFEDSWLPGYSVFGEGIFLQLDERKLADWEAQAVVQERVALMQRLYAQAQAQRQLRDRHFTARFLLAHSLAHALMNQLTFECGYSSAALRERLYISSETGREMAAVLIYTAAGDAEGTMGGLVRMGKPGYLDGVIKEALAAASWCAADPVCMELGSTYGQGPDSCNLAACHSCGLVPETACEEFNRFLDRGMLVGTVEQPEIGFFGHHGWLG